jgi:hypothetical protein
MAMVMPLLKKSGDESGRKVTMGSGNSGELFEKEVVLDDGNDATASASWIYKCLSHSNSVMFGFYLLLRPRSRIVNLPPTVGSENFHI